jgi:hypothetical protein
VGLGLIAKTAGNAAALLEVPTECRLEERAEDDISTAVAWISSRAEGQRFYGENIPEGRQSEPQQEEELEDVVEGEPVHHADKTLNDALSKQTLC